MQFVCPLQDIVCCSSYAFKVGQVHEHKLDLLTLGSVLEDIFDGSFTLLPASDGEEELGAGEIQSSRSLYPETRRTASYEDDTVMQLANESCIFDYLNGCWTAVSWPREGLVSVGIRLERG